MKKPSARMWFKRLTPAQRTAYVEKVVAKKMNDPKRRAKVDVQARLLIAERISMFGDKWRENCAIQVPKDFVDPFQPKENA